MYKSMGQINTMETNTRPQEKEMKEREKMAKEKWK